MADKTRQGRGKVVRVADVCAVLEALAPPALAAEWDNIGLLIGDPAARVRRVLLAIDLTGDVIREAGSVGADMVMAYHPPIFKPIARLTPESAPAAYAAARAGLAVYSTHTALDAAPGGTNDILAEAIGIVETRPLTASAGEATCKVVVFVPPADLAAVASAAFDAGAGRIGNYSECGFSTGGVGTFRPGAGATPAAGRGRSRRQVEELRLEIVAGEGRLGEVIGAVRSAHSYETPAIDVYPLRPVPRGAGIGRIGRLKRPVALEALLRRIKRALGVRRVLLAGGPPGRVVTAACCAGSCGSAFRAAVAAGAQVYVTGEMRHHDALAAAEGGLTVVCVGHSNSERIALGSLAGRVRAALPRLNATVSRVDRDPFRIV